MKITSSGMPLILSSLYLDERLVTYFVEFVSFRFNGFSCSTFVVKDGNNVTIDLFTEEAYLKRNLYIDLKCLQLGNLQVAQTF